ncbi:ABC transporter permease, partial [Nanoarchaeota archaeon]
KKSKTLARVTWFLTFSSLKRNKKLNTLVIAILAFSFLNVVFFDSVTNGMAEAIDSQLIDYMTGHIVIDPPDGERYIKDWRSTRNKLLAFSEVVAVTPELTTTAEIRKKDKFRSPLIRAIDPETQVQTKYLHEKMVAGLFLEEGDDDEILLGSDIAGGRYEKDSILPGVRIEADVGDWVTLTFSNGIEKRFKVKGIYRTQFLGLDAEAVIPLKTLQEILGTENKASQIIVRLYNKESSSRLQTDIINSGLKETVTSWEENAGFSRSITKSLGLIAKITGIIGILTAFVTVFIVIFIKTKNQRGQIATQRAVGISDKAIMGSYMIEALLLGIIGIIFGLMTMKFIIIYFTSSPLKLPIGDVIPVLTSATQRNSILLLLVSILFAGYYPTKRVLKDNIIDAIRGAL